MNKYRIIFILLCVGVYYAYREMQKTYKKIPNKAASVNTATENIPITNLSEAKRQKSKNQKSENIYFIMVDRYVDGDNRNNDQIDLYNPLAFHGGDLKGITSQLSYIKDLGITTIRLSNIQLMNKVPSDFYDSTSGDTLKSYPFYGSNSLALTQIDPVFGTEQDLENLVDKAHGLDLKVYLNLPMTDLDIQSKMPEDHFDLKATLCSENPSAQELLTCHFSGHKRLKLSEANIRKQVIEEILDFAQRMKLDGYYLENSRKLSEAFINELDSSILTRSELSSFNLLYDFGAQIQPHYNRKLEQGFFGQFIMAQSYDLIANLLLNKLEISAFENSYRNLFNPNLNTSYVENLTGSSIKSMAVFYKNNLKSMLSHLAMWGFLNQSIMFSYGEEKGIENFDFPYFLTNMPWEDKTIKPNASTPVNQTLFDVFKRLLNARKSDPALTQATVEKVYGMDGLHVWAKTFQGQLVAYLVLNLSDQEKAVFFKHPSPVRKNNGVDLLSGAAVESLNEGVTFTPDQNSAQLIIF